MRVIFPFAYYHPERCAGIYVVDDVMDALAEAGEESLLMVPEPTRNVPPDAVWTRDEQRCGGLVRIHRFRMFREGRNPLQRAFRYFLCECKQLHFLLWKKYDVVFIDSTPPIQGLKLPLVRLLRRKKVVYNVHDVFPDSLVGAGLARKGGLLWKIGNVVSAITYKSSDRIIAISRDIKKNLVAKGVPEEKIEVVYNWVDTASVKPVARNENPLFEEFGLDPGKFTVVYAGNLGNAQNTGIVLDVAEKLPDIQFVIFGTGGTEAEIRERILSGPVPNVTLLPLQPSERVSMVYSMGDACLVLCKEGFGGSAMPSKTWSIMSCARPVVASFDEGELKSIIEDNACGLFARAGDAVALCDALAYLSSHPSECEEMGSRARILVEGRFGAGAGAREYVRIIKKLF